MPTYEYQCKKCGYTFEKFQSITAKPLENCPVCNGPVYRLISKNGSFILKGSGYYSTDNRRSRLPKETKAKSDQTVKDNSDKSVSTESKTSTTKAPKESVKS
jgi:putative FmdB family regulatory protein